MLASGVLNHTQFVTGLYQDVLHRAPDPSGLNSWVKALDHGGRRVRVAAAFLVSNEYTRSHPDVTSFVQGLYQDVLGRASDPSGESFWERVLSRHQAGRTRIALDFLTSPESRIGTQPGATALPGLFQGQVQGVNVTPGLFTSAVSGNTAQVGIVYNGGDFRPRTVTIQVSDAGTYVLDQSTSFNISNNTGTSWRGYRFAILPSSTAQATFASSSDLSGQLPNVSRTGTSISYSGGTVPSSPSNPFLPRTTINTARGGTIVIQETPVV